MDDERYWYEKGIGIYDDIRAHSASEGRFFLEMIEFINNTLRERKADFRYGPYLETEIPGSWAFDAAGMRFDPVTKVIKGIGLYSPTEQTTTDGTHMTLDDALKMCENSSLKF